MSGTSSRSVPLVAALSASAAGAGLGLALGWYIRSRKALHDTETVLRAADFAARKHKDQRRKDPEQTPYVNHVIGVTHSLSSAGVVDSVTLSAALLHDTVEDTETSIAELQAEFGESIATVVSEVTDDKTLPRDERKRLQIEHTPHVSQKAKLVKLSDKLYNLRDLNRVAPAGWMPERVDEYFTWASKVVAGARGSNASLERQLDAEFDIHTRLFGERGTASA